MSSKSVSFDQKEPPVPAAAGEAEHGCNLDTLKAYGQAIQIAVSNFVMDYPLIAIVTTIVFTLFGLTMILPQFISTIIIYVPLLAFSYMAVSTLASEENREKFSHRLAESLFRSDGTATAAQLQFVDGALSGAGHLAQQAQQLTEDFDGSPVKGQQPGQLPAHKQRASDILPHLFGAKGPFSVHGTPTKATPVNSPV